MTKYRSDTLVIHHSSVLGISGSANRSICRNTSGCRPEKPTYRHSRPVTVRNSTDKKSEQTMAAM